ncbi:MAG: relaxase/mobilization nuclease domain-containing protein [Eubacteriales bacterium]
MATVNFINYKSQSKASMKILIDYAVQEAKTRHDGRKLVSGLNCFAETAHEDFMMTKQLYNKQDGKMFYHFTQSFSPDEEITPEIAHEVAMKLAEFYDGFEVLVATHVDRDHIHSHFVINSVSFETGKKLHLNAQAIPDLRQASDDLCMEYGLTICAKKDGRKRPMSAGEYRSALRGESWKMQLMNTIDGCMKRAKTKQNFMELMEETGHKVSWEDTHKYLVYTTPTGKKSRCNKLHEEKYSKEMMELEFKIRAEIINRRAEIFESTKGGTTKRSAVDVDTRPLGTDFYEPESDLGQAREGGVGDPKPENAVPQFSIEQGNRGSESQTETDSILARTGWEDERTQVFAPKSDIARDGLSHSGADDRNALRLLGDVVQFGKTVESLGTQPYDETVQDCTAIPHHIDKKRRQEMREKGLTMQ